MFRANTGYSEAPNGGYETMPDLYIKIPPSRCIGKPSRVLGMV
jgi:hypothetical protein